MAAGHTWPMRRDHTKTKQNKTATTTKTKNPLYFTTLILARVRDATGLGAMGNQL